MSERSREQGEDPGSAGRAADAPEAPDDGVADGAVAWAGMRADGDPAGDRAMSGDSSGWPDDGGNGAPTPDEADAFDQLLAEAPDTPPTPGERAAHDANDALGER